MGRVKDKQVKVKVEAEWEVFYGLFFKRSGACACNRRAALFCLSGKGKGMGAYPAGDTGKAPSCNGLGFYAGRPAAGLYQQEGVLIG